MRHVTISTFLLLVGFTTFSQSFLGPGVRFLAKKLIPAYKAKPYSVLTKSEVGSYVSKSFQLGQSEVGVYKDGYVYGVQQNLLDDPHYRKRFESPYTEAEKIAIAKFVSEVHQGRTLREKPVRKKIPASYRPNITQIQAILGILGYHTAKGEAVIRDGILGPETIKGIEAMFGIDCTGLTERQIIERIVALRSSEQKNTITYDLVIRDEATNEQTEKKALSQEMLNEELEKFTCSVGEICAGISEKSGSVQFDCGANGNGMSITTQASLEIEFTSSNGSSAGLSVDKNGKLKASSSDGKYTRGVTTQL